MLVCAITAVYFIILSGCQFLLDIVYTACLLNAIFTNKIGHFINSERDRQIGLESNFTIN